MLDRIGKYKVEREIGQGGFGKVYLAFDPDVGQPVAIKKLLAQGDPDLLKRFQLEIRTTASLRHKNIVTIHASGEEEGDPYLVMEWLEGYTLKQIIRKQHPLTLLDKVRIMSQIAEGLAYAHSKGVVHRDVKPENIMLLPDDTVKIMDFGIALGPNRNTAVTQTGGIIGTPPYFAPEQLEGLKATEQTDIFSYGDVCYELLTGVHPFEQHKSDWRSLQMAIMRYEPKALSEMLPGCPEALETLIHRTLAKEPEFRYQRFDEIQLDCEAILVDLKHEGAAAIVREVSALGDSSDLHSALSKINQAYQLDPGNREVRRLREEINLRIQRAQSQSRIMRLMAEAEKHLDERRYAEAVQTLESAAKFDTTHSGVTERLAEARTRLDNYVRANRLVSEARFHQQKGSLAEAENRLLEALAIDPEHADARRLSQRVHEELEKRRIGQRREELLRSAREHLAAKRFAEAAAAADQAEREMPGATGITELRGEIEQEKAKEADRQRAEQIKLAVARAGATIDAGDLTLGAQMVEYLETHYRADQGAAAAVTQLRERLDGLRRKREIERYRERAAALLEGGAFLEALGLLTEARGKYPGEPDLERLNQSAEERYRAHLRSEAIDAVVRDATARAGSGDAQGARDRVSRARQEFGDEPALLNLSRELAAQIEKQRYAAALEGLLAEGRALTAAGKFVEAAARLDRAAEFAAEPEVRALRESVRVALAIEEGRAAIRREIQGSDWNRAQAALDKARAELPGDSSFDDLAEEIASALYEAGWRELEGRINQHLEESEPTEAKHELDDQATRTLFAADPRWDALEDAVAKRKRYEDALRQADWQRGAERLSEAEEILTEIIEQGPPDQRAFQMRRAIQVQRSESLRQREIGQVAEKIREQLSRGDAETARTQLGAARSRYPGEGAWDELQAGLDTLQKQAAVAVAEGDIRKSLASGDTRTAAAQLATARARFPAHAAWLALDDELRRKSGAAATAKSIRKGLGEAAGAVPATAAELVERRQVNLRRAGAELDAARAHDPGEAMWSTLQQEVEARGAFLNGEAAVVAELGRCLERNDAGEARRRLGEARKRYSDPVLWEIAAADVGRCEERLKSRASAIADAADKLRTSLEREIAEARKSEKERGLYPVAAIWGALQNAIAGLEQARAEYPGEAVWNAVAKEIEDRRAGVEREIAGAIDKCSDLTALEAMADRLAAARARFPQERHWSAVQSAIEARREPLERASIARFEASVRDCLTKDDPQTASTCLQAARQRHPGARPWDDLQREIDAAQALRRRKEAVGAAEERARKFLGRIEEILGEYDWHNPNVLQWEAFQSAVSTLTEALRQFPGDQRLSALLADAVAQRSKWKQGFVEGASGAMRAPRKDLNRYLGAQIRELRQKYPDDADWRQLAEQLTAAEKLLARQAEVAAAADAVRASLQKAEIERAEEHLEAARKRYPGEEVWAAVEQELRVRKAGVLQERALEARHRQEARDRARDQLLEIERQAQAETRKRRRKELDREAQGLATAYASDGEISMIVGRVHALVDAPIAGAATPTAIPWKPVAAGAGALAAGLVVFLWLHNKKPIEEPKPPVATVPIEIRTDPPGAAVRLGDRSCTPPNCQLDLKPGSYPVTAELNGYVTKNQTVVVDKSQHSYVLTLEPVPLPPPPPPNTGGTQPANGTLLVQTGVPGVLVYVDGAARSRTDQAGSAMLSLEAKSHDVRVERSGYDAPPARRVTIASGTTQTLPFKLTLLPARLALDGAPAGVDVRAGGVALGRTDGSASFLFPAPVTAGDVAIEVALGSSKRGLQQHLEPGETHHLKWPDVAPAAPTPPPPPKPDPTEIENRDWERVRTTSDIAQLRAFVQTHPNGAHAPQATSRIGDLLWSAVDQSNLNAVQQFVRDNPDNPHKAEAQKILDQADESARQAQARQQALQKEQEKKDREASVLRQEVRDTMVRLSQAAQANHLGELKQIWATPGELFENAIKRHTMSFDVKTMKVTLPAADQAIVECQLVTLDLRGKTTGMSKFTFTLRKSGANWTVESAKAN